MCLMASTAGSALYCLVHMFEVQVNVTVPEVSELGGFRVQDNGLFMTAETEVIVFRAE